MSNVQINQANGDGASQTNGYDYNAVAENLMDEVTVGYRPQMPLEQMWQGGNDAPQITLRRDLYLMQLHPIVINALDYYRSGIAGAEFWGGPVEENPDDEKGKPISPDVRVNQFVLALCERFWRMAVPLLQEEGYPHGWCPGEHVYKEVEGMMVWSHLKVFHPNDGHILTHKDTYQPVGVRVKNIRNRPPIDLHLASESIPAKACWYAHRPRAGNLYGRSQLQGAWLPWRMLGWRDGMDQVINAAVYRAGYAGPVGRFPPGDSAGTAQSGVPATRVDGNGIPRRSNRDAMRQFVEWAKAGASFTLSSETYPGTNTYKWDIMWPQHVMAVGPLIDAARWAEDRIMLGIGVPPELVKASDSGSGYSGRSIPREAFLDGQQKVADAMLAMFVEQVLRPLVRWNFGDIPFNVQCKSLLKSQSQDKQGQEGEGQQGGGQQKPTGQQPPETPTSKGQTPQATPALSLEQRNKVLDIVRKVMRRAA